MPKIKNIQQDSAVTAGDKVLGSDTSGATRNYTMQQIANFVVESGSSHKHHQNTDSDTWTITHNFELGSLDIHKREDLKLAEKIIKII